MTSVTDEVVEGVRNQVQMFDGKNWTACVLEDVWPDRKIRLFDGATGEAVVDPDNGSSTEWTVKVYPVKSDGVWSVEVEPVVEE